MFTLASSASGATFALDLLVIFATAALVATLFRRVKMEAIPGYLVAGALVGPNALGLINDSNTIESISGLAIVLLMFGIGLELDPSSLKRGMASILGAGAISTAFFILFAWGIMVLFGVSVPQALVVAMAMSMSSTAVLVRVLQQRRETRRMHGRIGLGVSIVQDLSSILMLAMLPVIAVWAGAKAPGLAGEAAASSHSGLWSIVQGAAVGLGGVVALLLIGRFGLPRLLSAVTKVSGSEHSSELILVLSAAIALGCAILTAALGFSPEMGAFLGGFMLGLTPFRYQLGGQLAPLRDLLMAVFFTVVGLKVDPSMIIDNLPALAGGVVGIIVLKVTLIGLSCWFFGATPSVSLLSGVYLATASEFSLVVLGAAGALGILSPEISAISIAAIILSLMIGPMLISPAQRLAIRGATLPRAPWRKATSTLAEPEEHANDSAHGGEAPARDEHVIIAGFGPVGRALAERFKRIGIPFTVIELNATTVERQSKLGRNVVYGDATNPEVLESAGIRHASAIVLTIPDEEATLRACRLIRAMVPGIFIATRTSFLSRAIQAQELGADHVVVEEMATAEVMQREVLARIEARRAKAKVRTPDAAITPL
jgi:CPA2 family monovalent cation:H+ antiporter-2